MKKDLTVLIVTNNNDLDTQCRNFRETMTILLPECTKIHYAIDGYSDAGGFAGMNVKQAKLSDYDFIILSPDIAKHFGVPSVIDKEYKKPRRKLL